MRNKEAIEEVVRETAVAAGAPNPGALARELCLIMEGAYVTKHVTGNIDTIAIARRLAERALAAHLPATQHSSPSGNSLSQRLESR
jgi:hypothetical protein